MKCDCLRIGVECDPAGSVTEQFLSDFISVLFCLSREEYVAEGVPADRLQNPDLNAAGRMKDRMVHWPE